LLIVPLLQHAATAGHSREKPRRREGGSAPKRKKLTGKPTSAEAKD
jgi:hypothetical protein